MEEIGVLHLEKIPTYQELINILMITVARHVILPSDMKILLNWFEENDFQNKKKYGDVVSTFTIDTVTNGIVINDNNVRHACEHSACICINKLTDKIPTFDMKDIEAIIITNNSDKHYSVNFDLYKKGIPFKVLLWFKQPPDLIDIQLNFVRSLIVIDWYQLSPIDTLNLFIGIQTNLARFTEVCDAVFKRGSGGNNWKMELLPPPSNFDSVSITLENLVRKIE